MSAADVPRPEPAQSALARRQRSAARDAALRRITVWTVALALGSAGGAAAVVAVAGAPARATVGGSSGQDAPTIDPPALDPGADPGAPVGSGGQNDPAPLVQGGGPPPVVSAGS